MAKIKLQNPETGAIGELDPTLAEQAILDGYKPVDEALELFNPETGKIGKVPADLVKQAIQDGLPIPGSKKYAVANTGYLESLGLGVVQGVTAGFADEVGGAIGALSPNMTYQEARDKLRDKFNTAEEANPKTFLGGNIAGGVGSLFIPGGAAGQVARFTGAAAKAGKAASTVAKGAEAVTLGQRLGTAAKLGALQSAGMSEADLTKGQIKEFGEDVAEGATIGAATDLLTMGAGKVLGSTGKAIKKQVTKYFDPALNRQLAFGAMESDLKDATGKGFKEAVDFLEKKGVVQPGEVSTEIIDGKVSFKKTAEGLLPPNTEELLKRVTDAERDVGKMIGEKYKTIDSTLEALGMPLDKNILNEADVQSLEKLAFRANPGTVGTLNTYLETVNNRIEKAKSVSDLWELKQDIGNWIKPKNWVNNPAGDMVTSTLKLYGKRLDDKIQGIADTVIPPGEGVAELADLNKTYSAITKVDEQLDRLRAKNDKNATIGGTRLRDTATGLAAGTAAATGGATGGVAAVTGAAAAYANKFLGGTTSGRLLRAELGDKIPRETAKIKQWLSDRYPLIAQNYPQIKSQVDEILRLPDAKAAVKVKAIMPMFSSQFRESDYPTLLDGKVSSPQDVSKAQQHIEGMGLSPIEEAKRLSALNSRGELPRELYEAQDNINAMTEFAEKLKKMGY